MSSDTNIAGKPASFFDIDGTLIAGQMIFDFPMYLRSVDLFDEIDIIKIIEIGVQYKADLIPYRDAGRKILEIYAEALKGKSSKEISCHAEKFIDEHIKKKYAYTDNLIMLLKKKTALIALSASPIEPVRALKKYIPFKKIYGTELETHRGIYTGRIKKNMLNPNAKQKAMLETSKEANLDLKSSFAFGDSDADIEYLALVGHPIALNPNTHLKAIAEKNNWPIFHEDDPVTDTIKKLITNNNRVKR